MSETESYDPSIIFQPDGPIEPTFMTEAIRTLIRTLPLSNEEAEHLLQRRMYAAIRALSALYPRDEIEVMLGVQALCAYHAAASCWHTGMNLKKPVDDSAHSRAMSTAISAARTFETLIRGLERRQAKRPWIPQDLPEPKSWETPDIQAFMAGFEDRCRGTAFQTDAAAEPVPMTEAERRAQENEGLDIENTEGIRPDGSIIMPANPTPQQAAYVARRLALMYRREVAENRRNGITKMPEIRPLRTGDLVP